MKRMLITLAFLLSVSPLLSMPMPEGEIPTFPINYTYTRNMVIGLSIITLILGSYYLYRKLGDYQKLTKEEECEKEVK